MIGCRESRFEFDDRRIPREVSQTAPVRKESLTKFSKMRLAAVLRISAMRKRIRREVSQSVIACKDSLLKFCNRSIRREVSLSVIACKDSLLKFDNRHIPREVSQNAPVCKGSLTKFNKKRVAAILRIFVMRKRIRREV